jgi:hypothetical protein
MKRNEILGEQKKGVKAVKYNKKPKDATAEFGKAKEKLAPQKPLEEGAVKELTMDLKSMTDEEFQSRYKMSKAEARANLKKKEQGVAEGLGKTIKRGMAGWGAFDKDKPADVVKRVKDQDTDTLKGLSNRGSTGKGSPAELQQKAISRELKKRGEQGVAEGYRDRRDAYQRDYDSSVSGMGRRQSQAYQDDGGANDERHDLDPSEWYIVKDGKMFKITVYPHQEQEARARGFSPTREQAKARADANTGSTDEAMGDEVGKITKVDPATKKATLTKADGSSMEVDSTALKPTPDGKMQMDAPDLKTGTSVVSTENSVLTELDPPPNDSSSPIPGDNDHDEISKLLVTRLKRLAGL